MILEDSFKNPFSDYNANVMDSTKILELWCVPNYFIEPYNISESDVYCDSMPIVFMGGRGTGKTMFFKYFSYYVQKSEATRKSNNILSHLEERGGIGFYIRFDGPVLRSFNGKGLGQEIWDLIFSHYFELKICKSYLDVIIDLIKEGEIEQEQIDHDFVPKTLHHLGNDYNGNETIFDVLIEIEKKIREVSSFRADIAFREVEFNTKKIYESTELSFGIGQLALSLINEFARLKFAILIDEYENFDINQQKIINTMMKFVNSKITIRVGMRLGGFHTTDTISENEFIKEGRDYSKVVFENFLAKKGNSSTYKKFLLDVSRKRLEAVKALNNNKHTNIELILGGIEDHEQEAIDIAKGRITHFDLLEAKAQKEEIIELIKFPSNPLIELYNVLRVNRGEDPKIISESMNAYLARKTNEKTKKYKNDYVNKYKLSLLFLLASRYKKNKKYYSFNTFMFLSSGIVGNFIELCRRSFQYASFENPEKLIYEGVITIDVQNKAALDLADSELENVRRIRKYGDQLYTLAKNLGNIFREYHRDQNITYPETNQFSADISQIKDINTKEAFNAALGWSILQKKTGLQQKGPNEDKVNIYTLNRIFSPLFQISYRSRGGYYVPIDEGELKSLMSENGTNLKAQNQKARIEKDSSNHNQQKLFI